MTAASPGRQPAPSIALIGNPNTGKTTLFNALTGLSQHVGNYPGVTVEHMSGTLSLSGGGTAELIDLPGTYSLAAHAPDQLIAVDLLLGQQAGAPEVDLVLAIVDASNLRRNLYLVSQLLEVGTPVVVALNMTDIARRRGVEVNASILSARLGVPVVPVSARRRLGLRALKQAIEAVLHSGEQPHPNLPQFPEPLRQQAQALEGMAVAAGGGERSLSRVEAFRALVDAGGVIEQRLGASLGTAINTRLERMRGEVGSPGPLAALETEVRYAWIERVLEDSVVQGDPLLPSGSDRIDRLLMHRVAGVAVFALLSALVFQAIFAWAVPVMDAIDALFSALGAAVSAVMAPGPFHSLIVDGVVAGVGGVVIFLPQIAILFLFISVLEDCGYMARAALLMDRLLSRCGLSGKSFLPLLSSFACAVPGVMATRTVEDRRDRLTTMMVAPLMSCSARLPVYVLFIGAFIPDRALLGSWVGLQGLTLFAMYCVGAAVAVPVAWLLKGILLKGDPPPFLLEMPSYKLPAPRTVALRVYHSSKAFVIRAGSIILATTIVMWALAYFPRPVEVVQQYETEPQAAAGELADIERREAAHLLEVSYLGQAGKLVEPLVAPLGWDWRIGMATLASFPAREVIVSVLGTIYSLGGDQDETSQDLSHALKTARRPDGSPAIGIPAALSIMVFFALCAQCMSTLAVIRRESGSWGWPLLTFAYMTLLAYVGALATYRGALWLGLG
ncbi:MAG: ferrous iron transport protein B [Gemmatimonadetes bacterium]|nr:ferrous iron transport protein B [Gemmatimonadota bacterium]